MHTKHGMGLWEQTDKTQKTRIREEPVVVWTFLENDIGKHRVTTNAQDI